MDRINGAQLCEFKTEYLIYMYLYILLSLSICLSIQLQMKQLQQCYSQACSRITELERQNTMLKEQINLYAQNFSEELTNYVILEKGTFEHLKECLCEAYAKFEALKQEGNGLQARYNEAIKGFKELEQENKILRANNREMCKQLKAAGKHSDSVFSIRSSRRHGNIWAQESMLQSSWQFQPWMEVARDLEQVQITDHTECKERGKETAKPSEDTERSMDSVQVKGQGLCRNKPHFQNSDEVDRKGVAPVLKNIDRSNVHVKESHDQDKETRDSVSPNKVVRIQITLQRSNSSASSKADVVPSDSEKADLTKSGNTAKLVKRFSSN